MAKLLLAIYLMFSIYLFATIGDATRQDVIYQTTQIPNRIGETVEVVGLAIQERANRTE